MARGPAFRTAQSEPAPVPTPRLGLPAARQMPAQQLAAMAVVHQGHRRPAIAPSPDPTHVGGPALMGCFGHRGKRLDPGPEAHRTLAHLPALESEDALHGVLVKPSRCATVR